MRRSREILGLPIVTVSEGTEVGKVKDLVVDTKNREVVALLIDDPEWYKSPKAVLLSSLRGLGQDVVIIDSEEKISVIADTKELEEPLQNNVRIVDTRVITTNGKIVGRVKEYLVDPASGKITSYEVEEMEKPDEVKNISAEQILTLGSDVLIVSEEEDEVVFPKREEKKIEVEEKKETETSTEAVKTEEKAKIEEKAEVKEEVKAEAKETAKAETKEKVKEEAKEEPKEEEKAPEKEKGAEKVKEVLEERQESFLLGKTARKDILDDDGAFIIKKGEVITEEIINKAKETNKYLELSFSTKRF